MSTFGFACPVHPRDIRFVEGWFKSMEALDPKPDVIGMCAHTDDAGFTWMLDRMGKALIDHSGIRFDLRRAEPKKSLGFVTNEAMRGCQAEWVAMMPIDDRPLPHYGKIIQEHGEGADILSIGARTVNQDGNEGCSLPPHNWNSQPFPSILGNSPFRRKWWEKFPFAENTPIFDVRHWWLLRKHGAIVKTLQDSQAFIFCDRPDSFSRSEVFNRSNEHRENLLKELGLPL